MPTKLGEFKNNLINEIAYTLNATNPYSGRFIARKAEGYFL